MKRELRSKSVGTKVSEAELRVLESRAERAGLTLSEWVRDVLLGSSVEMGTLAAVRAILAEVLAMRTILLNFMLKVGEGTPIPEASSKKLIEWADANKMKRALEVAGGPVIKLWRPTALCAPFNHSFIVVEWERTDLCELAVGRAGQHWVRSCSVQVI